MSSPLDPTEEVEQAHQDAAAARLRAAGLTYRDIAHDLGLSTGGAYNAVQRALAQVRREPAEDLQRLELDHLDTLRQRTLEVLATDHVVTSGTDLVRGEDGRVLVDHGPTLNAIRALVSISQRRSQLLGLDEPSKINMQMTLAHAWANATLADRDAVIEAEIRELREEMARRGRPTPPKAETIPTPAGPAPDTAREWAEAELLAEVVEAALDGLGIPPGEAREAAYREVERHLRAHPGGHGNGARP